MRVLLLVALVATSALAIPAEARPEACASIDDAACPALVCVDAGPPHRIRQVCTPQVGVADPLVEVDATWLTACTGSGHREQQDVGPVRVTTYECDDGST